MGAHDDRARAGRERGLGLAQPLAQALDRRALGEQRIAVGEDGGAKQLALDDPAGAGEDELGARHAVDREQQMPDVRCAQVETVGRVGQVDDGGGVARHHAGRTSVTRSWAPTQVSAVPDHSPRTGSAASSSPASWARRSINSRR